MKKLISALLILACAPAWAAFPIWGSPKPQFFDSNGDPLANGTLSVLEPTDDTNKTYYPTADDADAATNGASGDITLNSRGETPNALFGRNGNTYKIVLKDSLGTTIYTVDDVALPSSLESRSVLEYGAECDGSTDDTAAFNAALVNNSRVELPAGTCVVGNISESSLQNVQITGAGRDVTTIKLAASTNDRMFDFTGSGTANIIFENFLIDGNVANQTAADGSGGFEGIYVEDGSYITIRGMEIKDMKGGLIRTRDTSQVLITDVIGSNCGSRCIYLHAATGGTPGTDDIYDLTIENTVIDNSSLAEGFDRPTVFVGGEASTATPAVMAHNIHILNNVFKQRIVTDADNAGSVACIAGQQREGTVIHGNVCENGGNAITWGNHSTGAVVSNNFITFDSTSQICDDSAGAIDCNGGSDNSYGIEIGRFSDDTAIIGNHVDGGGVLEKGFQGQRGVKNITVSGNIFTGIKDTAIEFNNNSCSFTISGASIANPSVITTTATHDFPSGQLIYIADIGGSESDVSDGFYRVGDTVTSTTFTLENVDETNFNNTVESTPSGTVECAIERVAVTGNVVDSDDEETFFLQDTREFTISGNSINALADGDEVIAVTGLSTKGTIANNVVQNPHTYFVRLSPARAGSGDTFTVQNVSITGNSIETLAAEVNYVYENAGTGGDFGTGIRYEGNTNGAYQGSISGAGAIDPAYQEVLVTTTGANALTLADGADGQVINIVMVSDGGNGTLTPSNFGAGTSITLDDVGDTVMLRFLNNEWNLMGSQGITVNP